MRGTLGGNRSVIPFDAEAVRKSLVDFIRSETNKAGFARGVLGVSGGVDSAVVAFLAAEALGVGNVLAAFLPYKTSSPRSRADAELVVQQLGLPFEVIDITPMVDPYLQRYGIADNIRAGNVMARERMIVLYDLSARERGLVIGSSNKTEILLGYGTLYGDTACAINPLGSLYKTQIWELAGHLGVPRRIIEKPPTADLWEGQTDEGELGLSYAKADELLELLVDEGRSEAELTDRGFDASFVKKVVTLIARNKFKSQPPVVAAFPR